MSSAESLADGEATGFGKKKVVLAIVAAIVVIAIIAAIVFFVTAVPARSAAKVGNTYISEDEVTSKIQTYRQNYGLTDDSDFASFLNGIGQTVSQFRESAINEIAIKQLVEARAKELGCSVSDEEVDARYREIVGENDTGEGSLWASVLEGAGLSEEILKDRYRYNILQEKVLAADVPERDATDDEVLSYVKEYLAGSTQVHISHIVIAGDAAETVAQECYASLTAARDDGTLTNDVFTTAAKRYSTESNVETTGGSVGWSGCGLLSDEVLDSINNMEDDVISSGTLLGCFKSSDGSYEIAYIDNTFTFPTDASYSSISDLGTPDDLTEVVKNAAKTTVSYTNDCSSYLTKLLESASITYYPMPSDVSYNVSLA